MAELGKLFKSITPPPSLYFPAPCFLAMEETAGGCLHHIFCYTSSVPQDGAAEDLPWIFPEAIHHLIRHMMWAVKMSFCQWGSEIHTTTCSFAIHPPPSTILKPVSSTQCLHVLTQARKHRVISDYCPPTFPSTPTAHFYCIATFGHNQVRKGPSSFSIHSFFSQPGSYFQELTIKTKLTPVYSLSLLP